MYKHTPTHMPPWYTHTHGRTHTQAHTCTPPHTHRGTGQTLTLTHSLTHTHAVIHSKLYWVHPNLQYWQTFKSKYSKDQLGWIPEETRMTKPDRVFAAERKRKGEGKEQTKHTHAHSPHQCLQVPLLIATPMFSHTHVQPHPSKHGVDIA